MSVRNIIHKILDTSKPLLRAGERNGGGVGLRAFAWACLGLLYSLGLKATISIKISKTRVCLGCVYGETSGGESPSEFCLKSLCRLWVWGLSRESVSVVRGTRVW